MRTCLHTILIFVTTPFRKGCLLLLFLLIHSNTYASLKCALKSSILNTEPDTTFIISCLTTNNDNESASFDGEWLLPNDWDIVPCQKNRGEVAGNDTKIQIFAIKIGSDASPGHYECIYLFKQGDYVERFSIPIEVRVMERFEIEATPLKTKVLAGNSYEVNVAITNHGNSDQEVILQVHEWAQYPWKISPRPAVWIPRGKTAFLQVHVATDIPYSVD